MLIFWHSTYFKAFILFETRFEVISGQLEVILRLLGLRHFRVFLLQKKVFFNPNLLKVSQTMIKSIINWFRNNLNINRENIFFSYDLTLWFHNFNSDFDPKNLRNEGSCKWLFCSPWRVDSENEIKKPFFWVAQLDGDTLKYLLISPF